MEGKEEKEEVYKANYNFIRKSKRKWFYLISVNVQIFMRDIID